MSPSRHRPFGVTGRVIHGERGVANRQYVPFIERQALIRRERHEGTPVEIAGVAIRIALQHGWPVMTIDQQGKSRLEFSQLVEPLGMIVVAMGGDHLMIVIHPQADLGEIAQYPRHGALASAVDQGWIFTCDEIDVSAIDMRIFGINDILIGGQLKRFGQGRHGDSRSDLERIHNVEKRGPQSVYSPLPRM